MQSASDSACGCAILTLGGTGDDAANAGRRALGGTSDDAAGITDDAGRAGGASVAALTTDDLQRAVEAESNTFVASIKQEQPALAEEEESELRKLAKSTICMFLETDLKQGREPTGEEIQAHFVEQALGRAIRVPQRELKQKGETLIERARQLTREKARDRQAYIVAVTVYCTFMD